jgi:hypothetical protein
MDMTQSPLMLCRYESDEIRKDELSGGSGPDASTEENRV